MIRGQAALALVLPFVLVALVHHVNYSMTATRVTSTTTRRPSFGAPSATTKWVQQRMPERRVPGIGVIHSGDESLNCTPATIAGAPPPLLDYVVSPEADFPSNCQGIPELCSALRRVAVKREVLVAVCDSNVLSQLKLFLDSTRKAGVSNVLVVALDRKLAQFLEGEGVAYWLREDAAKGSHSISAQKFKYIGAILSVGASVLVSDIDVIYVRNPFEHLYRDSDVEGTTDGWDAATAYGWTETVEDKSLDWAAYTYTHRSTAWNSGLWFIQATLGGARLMQLLAHRMVTEHVWDQTAYNEEVGLPARGSHSGAMISRRAANFLCFTNSKTLLRRLHREPQFAGQRIVESHINYHALKPQKMAAVYAHYHEGDPAKLRLQLESQGVRNTTALEEDEFLHINGMFVSGAALTHSTASAQIRGGIFRGETCQPPPAQLDFQYRLHYVPAVAAHDRPHCSETAEAEAVVVPCAVLRSLARDGREGGPGQGAEQERTKGGRPRSWMGTEAGRAAPPLRALLVALTADDLEALPLFLEASRRVVLGAPLLLAPLDAAAAAALDATSREALPEGAHVLELDAISPARQALDAHARLAAAFDLWRSLLMAGVGAMLLSPRVVLLRDRPLAYLHGDADVEVASEGWDDSTAYGYNHILDDPSMGHTRSCHGLRIAAHDAFLTYAAPTHEAVTLMRRVATRLRDSRSPARLATPAAAASLYLSEELFLPSHNAERRAGARTRVSNILCFGNSKLFFAAHLHRSLPSSHTPLAVHVSYHERPAALMRALLSRYAYGEANAMTPHLTDRVSKQDRAWCQGSRRRATPSDAATSPLVAYVSSHGPWAWSGMSPLQFKPDGTLETPWGKGSWGQLSGTESALFADFVGNRHNLRFDLNSMSRFASARCSDAEPVVGKLLR